QPAQGAEAAGAAEPEERVETKLAIARYELRRTIAQAAIRHREGERVALVGGAEDGAGHAQDVGGDDAHAELLELDRAAHQPHRALADAEDAPAIALDGAADDGADSGVEPGAIATAGQDADRLRLPRVACHGRPLARGREP